MDSLNEKLETYQVGIYFVAILLGALTGIWSPDTALFEGAITPALIVMLFVTFLQVPVAQLGGALRNVRFIGALLITNFLILPVISVGLLQFLPRDGMLRLAVLFVLLAPCIDYVIAFTHLVGGNARLLLAAIVQQIGRCTEAGSRIVPILDVLPVPATAVVLFVVLAPS